MARTFSPDEIRAMDFTALPQTQEFPAMQLYPKEWITGQGTRAMSPEQRGGFFDLLCEAWDQKPPCSLPDDDGQLANLSRTGTARWGKIAPLIRSQFVPCSDGRLRNPKQVAVWLGMRDVRDKRRVSRNKGKPFVMTNDTHLSDVQSPPAIADAGTAAAATAEATSQPPPRVPKPDFEGAKRIVEAFHQSQQPNPQLALLWIEKLGTVDAVLQIVWKYPNKGPDYIRKAIESAARDTQEKRDDGNKNRTGKPASRSWAGRTE